MILHYRQRLAETQLQEILKIKPTSAVQSILLRKQFERENKNIKQSYNNNNRSLCNFQSICVLLFSPDND